MDLITRDVGEAHEVTLSGVLDSAAASAVRRELIALVEGGARWLVLDMAGVSRIDSSGLGALVTTLKAVRERHGDLVLAALAPPVLAVIELTRLHRVFEIYDDAGLALEGLRR